MLSWLTFKARKINLFIILYIYIHIYIYLKKIFLLCFYSKYSSQSVCVQHGYCLIGDNSILQYLRFCLFEMYVNVVFVIRCLYSAVSLTQCFIRIIINIIIIIVVVA